MPRISKQAIKDKRAETFAEVYSITNSPSKAMLAIEPTLSPEYAKVKAQRTLKRTDIQEKIQKRLEKMQKEALKNIEKTLTSDNEQLANANAWKIVEHVRGKAVTRSISLHDNVKLEDALFD
jgi:uncharacterized protein YbaP (TraB family)